MDTVLNYILDNLAEQDSYSEDFCSPYRTDRNLSTLDQNPGLFNQKDALTVVDHKGDRVMDIVDHIKGRLEEFLGSRDRGFTDNILTESQTENQDSLSDDNPEEVNVGQVGVPCLKNGWREAVQWYSNGLRGYFGPMISMGRSEKAALIQKYPGMKYRFTNYKILYEELMRFDNDGDQFKEQYQEATGMKMNALLKAIRLNVRDRSN